MASFKLSRPVTAQGPRNEVSLFLNLNEQGELISLSGSFYSSAWKLTIFLGEKGGICLSRKTDGGYLQVWGEGKLSEEGKGTLKFGSQKLKLLGFAGEQFEQAGHQMVTMKLEAMPDFKLLDEEGQVKKEKAPATTTGYTTPKEDPASTGKVVVPF